MPGRTWKTPERKILEGNPGKRPIPDYPKGAGVPTKPSGMDPIASKLWDEIVDELVKFGARRVDTAMLQSACEFWAQYRKAMNRWKKDVTDKDARCSATQAWEKFNKAASSLGMDPISRSRMQVPEKADDDPLEEFGVVG